MTSKTIFLGIVLGLLINSSADAADPPQATVPPNYVRVCNVHGDGFLQLPGFNICLRVGGDVRTGYSIQGNAAVGDGNRSRKQQAARDAEIARLHPYPQNATEGQKMEVDYKRANIPNNLLPTVQIHREAFNEIDYATRGRAYIDAISATEIGTVRSYAKLIGDAGAEIGASVDEAFIQIGSFVAGRTGSLSNLTYGSYADNAIFGNFDIDKTLWLAGFTHQIGSSVTFSWSIEESVGSEFEVQSSNAEYRTDQDSHYGMFLPDIAFKAEFMQDWGRVGATGGFHDLSAEVSKVLDNPDTVEVETEDTEGDSIEIGRIVFFGGIGGEFSKFPSTKVGVSGFYTNGTLKRIGVGEFGVKDAYLHTPIENGKATETDEILSASGFTLNAGFSHRLNSKFSFHANSAFFSISEGRETEAKIVDALSAGVFVDCSPVSNLTFTVGGEFLGVWETTPADRGGQKHQDYVNTETEKISLAATVQAVRTF